MAVDPALLWREPVVAFQGYMEDGEDLGGLTRELFQLVAEELSRCD